MFIRGATGRFFQSLEKRYCIFSKHWKRWARFFQSLENRNGRHDDRGNQSGHGRGAGRGERSAEFAALDAVRVKYMGRKGLLPGVMEGLKNQPPAASRPEIGRTGQRVETGAAGRLLDEAKGRSCRSPHESMRESRQFDFTLPGHGGDSAEGIRSAGMIERAAVDFPYDRLHGGGGARFEIVFHNFDALNTPEDHPSRDLTGYVLSGGRAVAADPDLARSDPRHGVTATPGWIVAPGRCYRRDTTGRHAQREFPPDGGTLRGPGRVPGRPEGDLAFFAREMMGPDVRVRFRPHFFPFTEPSVEFDFPAASAAGGDAGSASKRLDRDRRRGLVPKVFARSGYDPERGHRIRVRHGRRADRHDPVRDRTSGCCTKTMCVFWSSSNKPGGGAPPPR